MAINRLHLNFSSSCTERIILKNQIKTIKSTIQCKYIHVIMIFVCMYAHRQINKMNSGSSFYKIILKLFIIFTVFDEKDFFCENLSHKATLKFCWW